MNLALNCKGDSCDLSSNSDGHPEEAAGGSRVEAVLGRSRPVKPVDELALAEFRHWPCRPCGNPPHLDQLTPPAIIRNFRPSNIN